MKRWIKLCLSLLMVFSSVTAAKSTIEAQGSSLGCEAFEVAWINDEGGFDTLSCHTSFEEAKSAMNQEDTVVRHPASKSPSKIIAMTSGIAYSYSKRNGSLTMKIYQSSDYIDDSKYKTTYVEQHRELFVMDTISYSGNGQGTVKAVLNGFEGFVKLEEVDLVPSKYLEKGLEITLGGQTSDNSEQPFALIPKQNYYSVVQNGIYTDLVYHFFSGYDGTHYSISIGPAAQWMAAGAIYYSADGVNFYADRTMKEYLASHYSYYQFLPLRSLSNVSAETFDAYLAMKGFTEKPQSTSFNKLTRTQSQLVGEGVSFVENQNIYGVNALMVYAMACLESSYGRSNFAVSRNNLFGWDAIDENPGNATSFSSISSGIKEHMAYNLRGYLDISDARYFGMHVGNKGSGFNVKYASDPYWGMKISSIAYDIDKFSRNYDGSLSDYGTKNLGLIEEFGASFLLTASNSSAILSTSEYSRHYQKNHTVILLGETDGYYQVQFSNAGVDADGNFVKHKVNGVMQDAVPYDFEKNIAFIRQESILLLNDLEIESIPGYDATGEFVYELNQFELSEEGELSVAGRAYRPGIYITENNQLIHTLAVFNTDFDKITEVRFVTEVKGETKDEAFFEGVLDLNDLEDGTYYFRLYSDYSALAENNDSREIKMDVQSVCNEYKDFIFNSDGDYTTLTITSKEAPDPDEYSLVSSLKSISMDENSVLTLHGISMIRQKNHTKEHVLHELIAVNMRTGEELNLGEIASSQGDYNLSEVYNDGFVYDYGWYSDSVDVSELPSGNYTLYVKTTIGRLSKMAKIYGTSKMSESEMMQGEDGLYRQLVMRYAVSYRVELSVTPYVLNKEMKNKLPRIREGYQNLIAMQLDDEKKILNVIGSSFIYNGTFDEFSEVEYTLYALNRNDGSVIESTVSGSNLLMGETPPWNNTERMNSEFNYDYTWYEINLPLNEMSDGEYDFILKVETKDYAEYIDVKKSSASGLMSYQDEENPLKSCTLSIDRNNKNRVVMNLSGFKTNE